MRADWQEATYYYTNTAPQWQGINNGNWKDVEHTVRKLADKTGLDLEVQTFTVVNSMLFLVSRDGRGVFKPVFRIWIHMFLDLMNPDPDPLVRCMDPDPDPSIIEQK